MKTKYWILIVILILVICLGLSFRLFSDSSGANFVQILSDNQVLYTLSLKEDQTLTIETEWGTNVVTIRDGQAAVSQASCPDHYCMERGFCSGGPDIVCLPNRLVLHFVGNQDVDTVIG